MFTQRLRSVTVWKTSSKEDSENDNWSWNFEENHLSAEKNNNNKEHLFDMYYQNYCNTY